MLKKVNKYKSIILLSFITIVLSSCAYSFTGSSVPNHLKTIAIPFAVDRSGSGEPNMADNFTSTLIEKFISDNSLAITDKSKSDALLDCTINSISESPNIIQGGETVSTIRLTINARVIYKDFVMKKTVFEKSFSDYADYSNTGDVYTNRNNAITEAIEKLSEEILLAVVSDW
ncbi:MAG: LptE family protein [Ignavibacteriae bacterium]|nr:LptE family protein [Ignavibacteriota bacterium]